MNFQKLWTKLYSKNSGADEIALHVSGATVRHKNPFEELEVPRNKEDLSRKFIDEWVVPFYMTIFSNSDDSIIKKFAGAAKEINKDIAATLLSDFNWRSRITGAYFSAINNYQEFEDIIGRLLLKSEVCYAGAGYCLALANFGTENAKKYLAAYLDYYLDRKDLWFDQADAFCALEHLDKDSANRLIDKWNSFVADKENWTLERSRTHFSQCMLTIEKIKNSNS